MYILIKGREDRPPNPKILVGEEEMKMRKFANRKAAEMARAQGQPASGPEWESLRNKIIEEIKSNPDTHGVSYLGNIPEGFSAGGPREPTDIPEEDLRRREMEAEGSFGDRMGETDPEMPRIKGGGLSGEFAPKEEEEEKRDPGQTSLFDFTTKKSQAMKHAWSILNY